MNSSMIYLTMPEAGCRVKFVYNINRVSAASLNQNKGFPEEWKPDKGVFDGFIHIIGIIQDPELGPPS